MLFILGALEHNLTRNKVYITETTIGGLAGGGEDGLGGTDGANAGGM